jgi:hypothetical protein
MGREDTFHKLLQGCVGDVSDHRFRECGWEPSGFWWRLDTQDPFQEELPGTSGQILQGRHIDGGFWFRRGYAYKSEERTGGFGSLSAFLRREDRLRLVENA